MADVILVNKRPTMVGLPNGVHLAPDPQGRGVPCSAEEYEKLRALRAFQGLLKAGFVVVRGAAPAAAPAAKVPASMPAELTPPGGLPKEQLEAVANSNVEEAGLLINATDNRALLDAWMASEKRVTVRRQLERRLAELEPQVDIDEDEEDHEGHDEDDAEA